MRYKDCTLYRIASGDDDDIEEFTVTVGYELHPPEPDIGIMDSWPEICAVYVSPNTDTTKEQYRITPEEFDELVDQLRNGDD
jgi:hypothetical protein